MDNRIKAEKKIKVILDELERDRAKVAVKINEWKEKNNWKGLDNPFMGELKKLTTEAFKEIDRIKEKYNI